MAGKMIVSNALIFILYVLKFKITMKQASGDVKKIVKHIYYELSGELWSGIRTRESLKNHT